MHRVPEDVLTPREAGLSHSELSVVEALGVARPLFGQWYCFGSTRNTLETRALCLAGWAADVLPGGAVVHGDSAAWLWLSGAAPTAIDVKVEKVHRAAPGGEVRIRLREGLPPTYHCTQIERLVVTTPLGTAVELLQEGTSSPVTIRELLMACGAWGERQAPEELLRGLHGARRSRVQRNYKRVSQAFR